jgi:hypothetical protein
VGRAAGKTRNRRAGGLTTAIRVAAAKSQAGGWLRACCLSPAVAAAESRPPARSGEASPLPEPGDAGRDPEAEAALTDRHGRCHERLRSMDRRELNLPPRSAYVEAAFQTRCPATSISAAMFARVKRSTTQKGSDQLRQRVAWALSQTPWCRESAHCFTMHGRLLRPARPQCAGRLSTIAGRRDAAPGDGRVPVDARQPEGGGRASLRPDGTMRAK